MKNGAVLLLTCLLCLPAFGRKKEKLAFTHTGEVIAHAAVKVFALSHRDDLFYAGDYVCLPGDEHHAPDCRTYLDWSVIDKFAYTEIRLDDKSAIIVCFCQEEAQHEPWRHDATTTTIRALDPDNDLTLLALRWEGEPDGQPVRFHYAIDSAGRIRIKNHEPRQTDLLAP